MTPPLGAGGPGSASGHEPFDTRTAAGRLMAATDWSATPLGPPARWPESLSVLVRTVLSSRYPMLVLWGEEFTQLYNDAYSALIGEQHPGAMGADCRITLADGWPVLGPLIDEAMSTGVASWVPALQLALDRAGYREEAYFSVSHAPAADDDGTVRGVLTVCSEVTDQVVGERRLRLLQELALERGDVASVGEVAAGLVHVLAADPLDVPFAAIYAREGGRLRRLAGTTALLPDVVDLVDDGHAPDPWGLVGAGQGRAAVVEVPPGLGLAGGPFGDPVTHAAALPVAGGDARAPLGAVLVGVSPSRALDDLHRSFLDLLVQQVGVTLRNAQAHEEERARVAALAELDRAKTDFFTNASHEFRTPLTLMLGPLQDVLADAAAAEETGDPGRLLPAAQRDRVATALRASRRLARLVDNLLTFAAVEAGSTVVEPRDVDLARLTANVSSAFRAAVERAGLTLTVSCPPLPQDVALDPDHWETVLTNLLSNALKFTFVGGLHVALDSDADGVRLVVSDTGVGIAADELPRLFERFHRVRGTRSRSHEGSGVGLSLVHELVTLMGGRVEVTSGVGTGTTFTVRLPWAALTPVGLTGAPGRTTVAAAADEAEGWLAEPAVADTDAEGPGALRVLVADDNADMRAYLTRLLREQGWAVTAVADGRTAQATALRDVPDLLLTDVMMPGLDGLDLVAALRADPRTSTLPVVVLSARAGEDASVEGLDLGADDYVVKPFDSRDLVARLRTTVALARERTGAVVPPTAAPTGTPGTAEPPAEVATTTGPALEPPTARTGAGGPGHGPWPPLDDRIVLPRAAHASTHARRWLLDHLEALRLDERTVFELSLALSEAVNNAVEHAQDPSLDEVEVRLALDPATGSLVVEVHDSGRWRERGPAMDRGHGASMMSAAGEVSMRPGPDGTVVTIRRDLGAARPDS